MKSLFSGLSAKLALAVLAVGTMFTSCYDSENVDIVKPADPEAVYYIAGNITDAKTGEALPGAKVLMDETTTVTVNGSFFSVEVKEGETHTFTVNVDGYYTATRTVLVPSIPAGGVSVSNADFALVSVLDAGEFMEPDVPRDPNNLNLADQAAAQKILDLQGETILAALDGIEGIDMNAVQLTVDEDGAIRLVAPASLTPYPTGEDAEVTLPYYHGFASTVSQSADDLFTRAVTDGSLWNASAAAALNRNYGLTVTSRTVTLPGVPGAAINGYTFVVYFTTENLSFGGYEGTVTYQGDWYVVPTYDSHDNHDLHNILHGNHNGAGGGNNNLGY